MFSFMLCLVLGSFVSPIYSSSSNSIRVHTPTAAYVGTRVQLEHFDKLRPSASVDQFLGIQYGLPPTGENRFRKSQPSWLEFESSTDSIASSKVKEIQAKSWPPACLQQPGFLEMALQNKESSEDCLYLNVWSPVASKSKKSLDLKPVFVWFHGGSFISDSISRKLYLGSHLSATADAIVVTVNYRVDAFGFVYSGPKLFNGTESAIGNQALWDQLLALEWIQEHIEYFGGDPKRVTIAGHNSGATSVGLHLLSPKSRQYFNRALMMSGSVFGQLVSGTRSGQKVVADMWVEAADKKIKCGDGAHWTFGTIKCLQKASTEDVLKLADPLAKPSTSPEVIIGDELFPFDNLLDGIADLAKSNKKIQILFGSTNDEGSLVLPLMNMQIYSLLTPKTLSREEAFEEANRLSSMLVTPRGSKHSKVSGIEVASYYINQNTQSNPNYVQTIGQALGDFYVSCPMVEFAQQIASSDKTDVYQYLWSKKFLSKEVPCADWMGACHGSDVVMLFGQPLESKEEFAPEDRRLSVHFMQTIGEFIHTGKPSKQEGKQWPKYELSNPKTGESKLSTPYYEFSGSASSKRIYRRDWKRELCSDLWRKYLIPKI